MYTSEFRSAVVNFARMDGQTRRKVSISAYTVGPFVIVTQPKRLDRGTDEITVVYS